MGLQVGKKKTRDSTLMRGVGLFLENCAPIAVAATATGAAAASGHLRSTYVLYRNLSMLSLVRAIIIVINYK